MCFDDIQVQIDALSQEAIYAKHQLEGEGNELRKAKKRYQWAEEAHTIIQQVAQSVQEQAHSQIAAIVSECLQTIFGKDVYKFKIDFVRKRGKTEAQLILVSKDGAEISNPCDEDSGGVMDVAAFALRLACLVLSRPKLQRLMVLDEPFRFVSAKYRPGIRTLLEQLSADFDIQFIMVTHQTDYMMGKVVKI